MPGSFNTESIPKKNDMQTRRQRFIALCTFSVVLLLFASCSKHDSPAPAKKIWTVSTLAGNGNYVYLDGADSSASFASLEYLAVDASGINVYVGDNTNQVIRKISGGQVTTIAGKGIGSSNPAFGYPLGLTVDKQNNLYEAEFNLIRKIVPGATSSKFAGTGVTPAQPGYTDGQDTIATLAAVFKVISGPDGNFYFADYDATPNFQVRKLVPGGLISTLPIHDNTGIFYYNSSITYDFAPSMTMDNAGNFYFTSNSNTLIKKMDSKGNVTVLAGSTTEGYTDGKASSAVFKHITSMAAGPDGHLYVVDYGNNAIREVSPDGTVSTLSGQAGKGFKDGDAATAMFFRPYDIAIDGNGFLYITDSQNFRIRKMTFK